MRAKIDSLSDYDDTKLKTNRIELLCDIKNICYGAVKENKYKPQAMHEALRKFHMIKQDKLMTESDYLEHFKTLAEVFNSMGCSIGAFQDRVNNFLTRNGDDPTTVDQQTIRAALDMAKEEYIEISFILSANCDKYGKMIQDLMN